MVDALLAWSSANHIWIDPRLSIRSPDTGSDPEIRNAESGISVFALRVIPNVTAVVMIPKAVVLSPRSCSYSNSIVDALGDEPWVPTLVLSLALSIELRLGRDSRWWGYLQSLPQTRVDLAGFWPLELDDNDVQEAFKWLQGTELMKRIKEEASSTLPAISKFHEEYASPLFGVLGLGSLTLFDFHHAFSLVSSRAFHVDAYHKVAMVPIADAFNHIEEHNIHLETDYHVCSTCGSLTECPHDYIEDTGNEDRRSAHSPTDGGQSSLMTHVDDVCEMVTNSVILPGDEVFNSYDSRLSNSQLMIQYGFMLEGNSNDLLKWDLDEIDTILYHGSEEEEEQEEQEEGWFSRMRIWAALANMDFPRVDVSHLLFTTSPPVSSALAEDEVLPRAVQGRKEAPISPSRNNIDPRLCLSINADAQVSQQLWLYLVVQRLPPLRLGSLLSSTRSGDLLPEAEEFSRAHEYFCNLVTCLVSVDDNYENMSSFSGISNREELMELLESVADDVVRLCETRIRSMHMSHLTVAELGKMLSSMGESTQRRTRMAFSVALSERMVLESCSGIWKGVDNILGDS